MTKRVVKMIADIIKVNPNDIEQDPAKFAFREVDGWDSLAQLSIMTGLEDELGIDISIDEMESLDSVDKIIAFVEKRS